MEKEFSRVRSTKDFLISSLLIISGSVLVTLPTSESVNILGFFIITTGLLLAIFLRSGYKDQATGKRYCKKELYFDKSRLDTLSRSISTKICASDLKEDSQGNGIRLDVYHSKSEGKSYVQLFEYVPYKYEPCSTMYEHTYENIEDILKL